MWSVETEIVEDALGIVDHVAEGDRSAVRCRRAASMTECGGRMYSVSLRQQWDHVGPRRSGHRHAVE